MRVILDSVWGDSRHQSEDYAVTGIIPTGLLPHTKQEFYLGSPLHYLSSHIKNVEFLTCRLYVSNCARAAFAFFNSSSKLTVLCMYIMLVSCKDFTCLRRSFKSCNFWRYTSTVDSSLFALSEVAL